MLGNAEEIMLIKPIFADQNLELFSTVVSNLEDCTSTFKNDVMLHDLKNSLEEVELKDIPDTSKNEICVYSNYSNFSKSKLTMKKIIEKIFMFFRFIFSH